MSDQPIARGFDPGGLENEVYEGADRLEKASDALYNATMHLGRAEREWDKLRLTLYAELYHDSMKNGHKLPGEEVRQALAIEQYGDSETYLSFCTAKARLEALEKSARPFAAAVSAKQSVLKARGGG